MTGGTRLRDIDHSICCSFVLLVHDDNWKIHTKSTNEKYSSRYLEKQISGKNARNGFFSTFYLRNAALDNSLLYFIFWSSLLFWFPITRSCDKYELKWAANFLIKYLDSPSNFTLGPGSLMRTRVFHRKTCCQKIVNIFPKFTHEGCYFLA